MYTLSPNEKLGMQVEQLRLAEIRQEIEARRLASEIQGRRFGVSRLIHALTSFVALYKIWLIAKVLKQLSIRPIAKSQTSSFERN